MIALSTKPACQKGATLIISLIILVLMTLISITTIQVSTQQEKMVANARDLNNAFQAAESGLRRAEQMLYDSDMSTIIFPAADCVSGYCKPKCVSVGNKLAVNNPVDCNTVNTTPPKAQWEVLDWESTATPLPYQTYDGGDPNTSSDNLSSLPGVVRQPRYIIENITPLSGGSGGVTTRQLYRITAKGYGATADDNGMPLAQVTLQTIYEK